MKKCLLLLLIFTEATALAQRWYAINDSTSYTYQNMDITVGRNKVYRNLNNTLTLVRDFSTSNPNASEDYIRDFDFIDENTWYVLVGSRYIGQRTELHKTTDAGTTWELITPQSFTIPSNLDGIADSINQIQFLNGRIYLFDTYYTSRVFYSDDLGQTWTHWFECFWSHYYQIYACGNDLYIHGLAGDGFRPYMVQIPSSYFGQQNIFTTNVGGCNNSGTPGCYHAPANITVPATIEYFKNLFDTTICNTLDITDTTTNKLKAFPNPINDYFTIEGIDTTLPFHIKVYNNLGQCCLYEKNKVTLDFSYLASGGYFVTITQNQTTKTIKVFKQ
jgi:Secretion system C-terminal sorting domain